MKRSRRLRQIGIGAQLRKLRENSAMTTRSVARALGISSSSINRTELGQRVPGREEVSALCALYGVTGEQRKRLIERVDEVADTAAWLEAGHISDDLASLIVLEQEAKTIINVGIALVHGLGQTADYARLVLGAGRGVDVERQVITRLGRQAILSRPDAPNVRWLIHEAVLHRTLGDKRVLRDQLEHLITLQRRANVSLRVIPFDAPTSPATDTPFSLYELPDGSGYVFVDAPKLGVFITEPSNVKPFVERYRMLSGSALDEHKSHALIRKGAEGLSDD